MAYSPGEGPVPFTYSAEAFPLYVRGEFEFAFISQLRLLTPHLPADVGMSYATAVTWLFNFVRSHISRQNEHH